MTSIWNLISSGGVVMYPLLLTSVISLAVIIERALFLRRSRILRPEILEMVENLEGSRDLEKAAKRLRNKEGPFINIIRVGLENRKRSRDEIKEVIVDQGRQETRILERGLAILETIAGIAPLLGLLGTVLGMIKVFKVISIQGLGQTQSLSGGISEALVTTVVGLSIAIPTLVAYNYFNHKVENLVLEIEKYSSQMLSQVNR